MPNVPQSVPLIVLLVVCTKRPPSAETLLSSKSNFFAPDGLVQVSWASWYRVASLSPKALVGVHEQSFWMWGNSGFLRPFKLARTLKIVRKFIWYIKRSSILFSASKMVESNSDFENCINRIRKSTLVRQMPTIDATRELFARVDIDVCALIFSIQNIWWFWYFSMRKKVFCSSKCNSQLYIIKHGFSAL